MTILKSIQRLRQGLPDGFFKFVCNSGCSKERFVCRLASLFGAASQLDDASERNESLSYRPPKQPEISTNVDSDSGATPNASSAKSNVLHAVAVHAYLL